MKTLISFLIFFNFCVFCGSISFMFLSYVTALLGQYEFNVMNNFLAFTVAICTGIVDYKFGGE